jgi:signal transduction histidine kinase
MRPHGCPSATERLIRRARRSGCTQDGAWEWGIVSGVETKGAADAPRLLLEACHDMRQPIAGVLALAGATLTEPGLPTAARARLEQIVQQAEWLADMVQSWLQADQPDESGVGADLATVVSETMAARCAGSPVEVNVVWPAEPVRASVHPVVIRRIMANVLDNAIRAAGPSGRVTVEIRSQDDRALVVVDDSGPGFGRIQGGLGLGLRAAARNVAGYGGRLECGCAPLGGLRVSLWLPLSARLSQLAPVLEHRLLNVAPHG